ncbi:aldehyde dehydrogenase family protein [Actinocorallia sp. API 0066]|uniref:aldehyde dehydrogenase family protein n=1 Tax=Actinocorallia sp. API 0066 TaxID=2896846 RepID=UPI001E45A388|nr:aldehyde dehydrogenase family protein [Actinocorallia sp. API 0066]MCD0449143.1 aldehyde dehydrogenase family protein [Actinocorallia sp. API 0066]
MTETPVGTAITGPRGIPHYRMFIGGEWVDSDELYELINPATEEVFATAAKGGIAHADQAVAAAKRAFESGEWRDTPPLERAAVIDRVVAAIAGRIEELGRLGSLEGGAPIRLSTALSVGFPLLHMGHYADLTRRYEWERAAPVAGPVLSASVIRREPLGVCLGIVPWNFPLIIAVWKSIPAIAAGNTVVLKVDEKTPIGALELAQTLRAAGLPDGVLNVVTGDGETVGAHLVAHPDIRLASFTGSTAVGREVGRNAAGNIKRTILELGGKGPNIVLDDADLDVAVDGSIYAFLLHAGQACESGTRLLLPSSLHDEFIERLRARLGTLRIGDPLDPATDIGPVMSAEQHQRILGYIEAGRKEGATVAIGGNVPTGPGFEKGYWIEPTVFTDVRNDMCVAAEEIFGPVLSVIRYDSVEDAIKIANDTEYGLSAGIWSTDIPRALEIAKRLEAGSVWINDWHNISHNLPFGGFKQSGNGRELGPDALDEYTDPKAVTVNLAGGLANRPYGLVLGTPPGA